VANRHLLLNFFFLWVWYVVENKHVQNRITIHCWNGPSLVQHNSLILHSVSCILFFCSATIIPRSLDIIYYYILFGYTVQRFPRKSPRLGSRVVRLDPLRFLARCCKRRLNQALSVLSLSLVFF